MGITGEPRTIYMKHKFVVEVDGFTSAAWESCTELKVERTLTEYYEGGAETPDYLGGRKKFSPITLTRAKTKDDDALDWIKEVFDANIEGGQILAAQKRNLDIVQLDLNGDEVERYNVLECCPTSYSAGDWDNNSDDPRKEVLVLQPKSWKKAA